MIPAKRSVIVLLFFLFVWTVSAFDVPPLTGRVVDQAGLFSKQEKEEITQIIRSFEKATGGQLFVAVLNPFDDVSPEEAGIALMDQWKPGQKGKDNGAILLIVPKTRKMRLEIGYGWEGEVNDAKAGDIIRLMAKFFKENRYCDGTMAAIGQLAYDITGKKLSDKLPAIPGNDGVEIPGWLAILLIIGFTALCIRYPWLLLLFLGGSGGRRGGGGGGFTGGGGGRGGGGGASGGW